MPAMLIQARQLLVLFLVAISTCAVSFPQSSSTPATPGAPKSVDPSKEPSIIEELTTLIKFENDGSSSRIFREKAKIQTEAGLREFGIVTFTFKAGDEFTIDMVEVHKGDGRIVKAGPANVQEITPEVSRLAPMYSDIRQKQVTVPGLSLGDEIYLQYTSKESALVPNQFWYQYSFSKHVVVLSETVEVSVPSGRKIKLNSEPEHKPATRTEGDRTVYVWHSTNPKPEESPKDEGAQRERLATGTLPAPSLEISTFESWEAVGAWYYGLQNERAIPTAAVKAKALELTKGKASAEDKVKALYQFVSLNFRYISLDFGIGRYQPHSADMVLANGYGDCKDKHTLLAAMLEAVGLKAYPALINTAHALDTTVPSPAQFDHVITAVPVGDHTVFVDATQEVAPYGMLVLPLRNKQALVMKDAAAAQFVRTPEDLPFQAFELFELDGKLDDAGTLDADVTYFLHGDAEVLLKNALRRASPSKHKDIIQYLSAYAGFGGEVSDVKLAGLQDTENGLKIQYHYLRKSYVDLSDNPPKNSLPIAATRLQEFKDKESSLRLYASPAVLTYKCRVELPAGVTAQIPLPVNLHRDYMHYESSYTIDKNALTGMRRLSVSESIVALSHRQDYEAFRRSLQSDEGQQMVLRIPEGFAAKAAPFTKEQVEELTRQADIEYREKDFSGALRDYRKIAALDTKRKGIWTQIALVEGNMRMYDQAIQDYQKAVAADPFDAQAHAELGGIYMSRHESPLAVKELNKAAEIDPLLHRAHYLLGWFYAQQLNYPSAVPELEKALATEADGFNDQSQINGLLATGYLKTRQTEKAVAKLKDVVAEAPNPVVWNNAAYTLADNDAALDLAHQYADSALHGIYERLNQLQPDTIRREHLAAVHLLSLTWDTMGWIYFKSGDLPLAEKYLLAAWRLGQSRETSMHLAQVYEKQGRIQESHKFYAISSLPQFMQIKGPVDPGRARLTKLVGRLRAEQLIRQESSTATLDRTLHLGKIAPAGSKGEFFFVFAPGPKLLAITPVGTGENLVAPLFKQQGRIAAPILFPETAPEKLVREGLLYCSKYEEGCDLVFYTSDVPANAVRPGPEGIR